ncbi:hypothetical protein [Cryobacterium sp. MDB2-10]|uniref:hypothetical protein n=1 Tax=Cryobacterium sp. MDB2-10 TaxID=1259177 RepID=UPI00107329CC|nr:hypothetical protein [Cryobacterium sp. MDB2-10]TFC19895.1 hypothetical protein E3O51_06040 [Cryobacterium sp. MDB2-10]
MSISDWINAILAILALAGVAVAIWAVLLSEHSTRSAFGLARLDVVADLAAELAAKTDTLQSAMEPLWRLANEQSPQPESKAEPQIGAAVPLPDERSQEAQKMIDLLVAELETMPSSKFRLLLAAESLPAEERIRHSQDLSNQLSWLRACMTVMCRPLVDESTRPSGTKPRSNYELLAEIKWTYKFFSGENEKDGEAFLGKAKESFALAEDEYKGMFFVLKLVSDAGSGLLDIVNEISHSLEYKRTHRRFVIPHMPKKNRELGKTRKVPARI